MGVLRGIEHRIESLVEGVFGRAFRAHVQPVELARKLVKEMDDHRSVSVSRVYVPNEYVVYLAPRDREQFQAYEDSLVGELAEYLAEHARREGYALISAPRVLIQEDGDLAVGEFGIATRLVQPSTAPTRAVPTEPSLPPAAPAPPPPAPLQPAVGIEGTRVYPKPEPPAQEAPPTTMPVVVFDGERRELPQGVTTIGRSKECDLAIDDPSVSRKHAELRHEGEGVSLVDLGSTNGTEVNGRRIDRARLTHGDKIAVGQTELRFEHP